jgi:hypothetical protein
MTSIYTKYFDKSKQWPFDSGHKPKPSTSSKSVLEKKTGDKRAKPSKQANNRNDKSAQQVSKSPERDLDIYRKSLQKSFDEVEHTYRSWQAKAKILFAQSQVERSPLISMVAQIDLQPIHLFTNRSSSST